MAFQFTHPGGVRLCDAYKPPIGTSRFNSRTREGCDSPYSTTRQRSTPFQFTHPGGVRQVLRLVVIHSVSFNSRTREGCDGTRQTATGPPSQFQFTHPGGVRLEPVEAVGGDTEVSIHAPGRGATHLPFSSFSSARMFQFTHPGGVRQTVISRRRKQKCFNSRTREGCDGFEAHTRRLCRQVSIHAPGRGATVLGAIPLPLKAVSIHAPGRGATGR